MDIFENFVHDDHRHFMDHLDGEMLGLEAGHMHLDHLNMYSPLWDPDTGMEQRLPRATNGKTFVGDFETTETGGTASMDDHGNTLHGVTAKYVGFSRLLFARRLILTVYSDAAGFGLGQSPLRTERSLGDLQLATELMDRALCMNIPADFYSAMGGITSQAPFMPSVHSNYPPSLGHCSSPPETSYGYNEDEDGSEDAGSFCYRPLDFPPAPTPSLPLHLTNQWLGASIIDKQTPEADGLTPLEMPDGSMRLTANWLPVDPEGGFTISDDGPRTSSYGRMLSDTNTAGAELLPQAGGAFFTMDSDLPAFGG